VAGATKFIDAVGCRGAPMQAGQRVYAEENEGEHKVCDRLEPQEQLADGNFSFIVTCSPSSATTTGGLPMTIAARVQAGCNPFVDATASPSCGSIGVFGQAELRTLTQPSNWYWVVKR
jgi:hypothetical protein